MQKYSCPCCDYSSDSSRALGLHYYHNQSHRPTLSKEQREIVVGLLMGDGSIINRRNTPRLAVTSITKEYLDYLEEKFGGLSTSVFLEKSAEECAKINRESGFSKSARKENYSDLYKFQTRASPEFEEFSSWYDSGSKIWPEGIELTPTVLKNWYVGDGNIDNGRIRISLSNERTNKEKVEKYFENRNLPCPDRWGSSDMTYKNSKRVSCRAIWSKENSATLINYMGEPLPGFEYKWEY
jgi:hypothetical protein